MLAVFVQLFCGFCLDVAATVEGDKNPNTTAFGWGFATMSAIYISGLALRFFRSGSGIR